MASRAAQALARQLPDGQPGDIVNLNDFRALRPGADHFPYTISKVGLHGLTVSLAAALAPFQEPPTQRHLPPYAFDFTSAQREVGRVLGTLFLDGFGLQEQHLRDHQVRQTVVDRLPDEDDAVLQ